MNKKCKELDTLKISSLDEENKRNIKVIEQVLDQTGRIKIDEIEGNI